MDIDFSYKNRYKVIEHLEDEYNKECVCHIGTFSQLGVKSGLKDIARVLEIPFEISNTISKEIDKIVDVPPQPTFKDYDKLKDSTLQKEKDEWEIFNKLEKDNREIFRIARNFEGLKRGFGVHASAHLVMPEEITNVFPTRLDSKTGVTVTLFSGVEIEELGGVKLDLLGLASLDVISDTLYRINKEYTFEDLYKMVDINDPHVYEMLTNGESDCIFQLGSNMFKNMLKNVKPNSLDDISVITSLGRPGPLSVGMDKSYAEAKNEGIKPPLYLRDIEDITDNTLGVIAYQEQLMQISKKVSGFDASQSDSLMRKAIA